MVRLSLSTSKGNAGIRHFPFQGYLGLTPVRVDGLVRTRTDDDLKPVLAASLTVYVRAYESRQPRLGAPHHRVVAEYLHTVWRAPDGTQYAPLADFDAPFKITLPKRAPGFSTANFQDYRTFWRVEAVLEHLPSPTVGQRIVKYFELPLVRYDIPPPLPTPSPSPYAAAAASSSSPTLPYVSLKPRAPVLHYNLSTPPYPIGPADLLFTSLFVRPQDPAVSIRSASLLVERRIELAGTSTEYLQVPFLNLPPQMTLSSSLPERDRDIADDPYNSLQASHSTSTLHSTASASTVTSRSPLLPPTPPEPPVSPSPTPTMSSNSYSSGSHAYSPGSPSPLTSPASPAFAPSDKVVVASVAAATFPSFALDAATGIYSKTVSLQWPESRSHSRWSMGESMKGALASVSFWVRVKVIVTSPTTGTETVDLAPRELSAVLTNDAERRQASAHFAEAHARSAERRRAATAPGSSSAGADEARVREAAPDAATFAGAYVPPRTADAAVAVGTLPVGLPPPPPVPSPSPAPRVLPRASGSVAGSPTKSAARKKSRRPHTSAGPQDRGRDSMRMSVDVPPLPHGTGAGSGAGITDTTNLKTIARAGSGDAPFPYLYMKPQQPLVFPAPGARPGTAQGVGARRVSSGSGSSAGVRSASGSSGTTSRSSGSVTGKRGHSPAPPREAEAGAGAEVVRAWEEELARIERASKRGSQDMLGFLRRRDRTREREGTVQVKEARMVR